MVWSHKWRDQIANGFYYKLLEKGTLSPDDREPEIGHLSWFFEAFMELSSCRSIGMALGPIPFTAIVEYSRIYNIEGEDFDEFSYLIRRLDNKYLELEHKKSAVKSGPTNANKNNSRRR